MIVPQFWVEARIQERFPDRQITVRRFGWSDVSPEEAQAHADARVKEAFARVVAGEKLLRREPRVAYNGADGVPIREEIVSRHGETIITRNSYGARCLNTPDVAFADVDQQEPWSAAGCGLVALVLAAAACWMGWQAGRWKQSVLLLLAALGFTVPVYSALERLVLFFRGGASSVALKRIGRFLTLHPHWRIRLYRTPAGFRLLFLHRTFDPRSSEAADFFKATGTDPQFASMCRVQNCFRARVSPKPWRTGMDRTPRPRRSAWPVQPEYLQQREDWIKEYEIIAADYASCEFIGEFGDGPVHESARAVQLLHDEMCRAESHLPLA